MRRKRAFILGAWILATVIAPAARAAPEPRLADAELQACLDRALPERTMTQRFSIRVFDSTGSVAESRAVLYWKRFEDQRSRLLVRLSAPPMRAGIAVLAIERERTEPDMYLYLPELRQTRRVSGRTFSGSMLGTDFSYEDFAQFHGIVAASEVRRLSDEAYAGRPAYVVELIPQEESSSYSRVVSHIDQAQCLPLAIDFVGRDGAVHKELRVDLDSVHQIGGRYVPYKVVMHDHKQNSRTELVIDEVELDIEIRDADFAPSALATGR